MQISCKTDEKLDDGESEQVWEDKLAGWWLGSGRLGSFLVLSGFMERGPWTLCGQHSGLSSSSSAVNLILKLIPMQISINCIAQVAVHV